MSNFENEFINRFKDQQSLEGVDSAGIWSGVDAALSAGSARGAGFYFTRGGMVLLALLLLLGGGCLYQNNASTQANIYQQNESHLQLPLAYTSASFTAATPSLLNVQKNASHPLLTAHQENGHSKTIAKGNDIETSASQVNADLANIAQANTNGTAPGNVELIKNKADGSLGLTASQNEGYKENSGTVDQASKGSIDAGSRHNNTSSSDVTGGSKNRSLNASRGEANNTEEQNEGSIEISSSIETNENNETVVLNHDQQIQFMHLIKSKGIDNDQKRGLLACGGVVNYQKSLPIEASFMFGVNSTNPLFEGDGKTEIKSRNSDTHSSDIGFNTQLGLTYLKNERFRFSIGLGYQEWNTKFEETTTSATSFEVDDRIIGFTQDTSGTFTPIFGTLTFDGTSTRHVLHHNKLSMISIPFEVGYQIPVSRSTFGFNAGLGYNFVIGQAGRSIDSSGNYAFFENSSSTQPFSKHLISVHTSLFVDYAIRENLSVRLSPQLTYIGGQNGNFYTGKARLINYGLNIGMVWDF